MLGHGEGQEFSTTAITAKGKSEKRLNHGGRGGHDEKQNRPRAFQPRRIRRKTGKTMRNAEERESGRFLSPFIVSAVFAMSAMSVVSAVPVVSVVFAVVGAFPVQVTAVPFSSSFPRTRESSFRALQPEGPPIQVMRRYAPECTPWIPAFAGMTEIRGRLIRKRGDVFYFHFSPYPPCPLWLMLFALAFLHDLRG